MANVGDVFWVRETFHKYVVGKNNSQYPEGHVIYSYRADNEKIQEAKIWKPSIFMPKDACRLFLKVKNVRVEKLHDISDDDAKREGIYITDDYWGEKAPLNYMYGAEYGYKREYFFGDSPYGMEKVPTHSGWKASFFTLWWSINGKESLESNPFVWVYDFEIINKSDSFK